MEFITLEVGGINTVFLESGPPVTVPFRFVNAHRSTLVLIQGFNFSFDAPDNELERVSLSTTVYHGAGDRSGTIEVHFSMVGDRVTWPWVLDSNLIDVYIKLLVIGTEIVPNNSDIIL